MNRCLIVVDYQNDFVIGSLGFPEALALDERIAEKIAEYRESGDDVIFTFDTHDENYLKTREGRYLTVEHCVKGTNGHELYGKVGDSKTDGDRCFYKPGFGSDELYMYLKERAYSSIELVGVVSNICVISNAVLAKTAQPEADIIIDASCVASNDERLNKAALEVMESLQMIITNKKDGETNE